MTTTDLDYDIVFAGLREQIGAEVAEQFDALVARLGAGTFANTIAATPEHYLTTEKAAELRAAFPPEAIGKLPRVSCRQCSDSQSKVCQQHSKQKCEVCDNYMTTQHVHLDYVGHAAVTDRLLHVDPLWSWEPVAWDPTGAPMIQRGDKVGRLWIRLTVCGVTRLGVGIAEMWKQEVEKELIGDALRNAAMRFGVALDLWSKEDLRAIADAEAHGPPAAARQAQAAADGGAPSADPEVVKATSARIDTLTAEQKADVQAFVAEMGASWPWPKAVCVAINRRIDDLLTGEPDTPSTAEPPPTPPAEPAPSDEPDALPPADGLPTDGPCELCGSTRAAKAIVHGVRRCQNATDCKKRQEAKEAEAAGAEPTDPGTAEAEAAAAREHYTGEPVATLDPGDAARLAETGDEDLFCAGCNERIVGELPVFGEHEEAYHVACSPAFIGES